MQTGFLQEAAEKLRSIKSQATLTVHRGKVSILTLTILLQKP